MQKEFFTLDDFNLEDKNVLLRVDINSPIDPTTGNILDDSRLKQHAVTIKDLTQTKLIILAHQSRPGKKDFTTMEKHAERLSYLVGREVKYIDSLFHSRALDAIAAMNKGDALLLENTRFYAEEVAMKDAELDKMGKSHIVSRLGAVSDYFVIDCFATAHRAQPSIIGFSNMLPTLAGRVMEKELKMLNRALHEDNHPKIGVFGGIKVDDSIKIIRTLLKNKSIDKIIPTGAVANIFLIADGMDLGKVNIEFLKKELDIYDQLVDVSKELLKDYRNMIAMPVDLAVNENGKRKHLTVDKFPTDLEINDLGVNTIVNYCDEIGKGKVIILNGPSGVFENEEFSLGTIELFKAIANVDGFKVAGGGHTIAAIEKYGLTRRFDHLSTGGGSLINFLAGKKLPAIEALKNSKIKFDNGEYKKK